MILSKRAYLYLLVASLAALLLMANVAPGAAQETQPAVPGMIVGTGTHFSVTDSDYLNVSVDSTSEINLLLNSDPAIIVMRIEAASGATWTEITLGGLAPNTTYWKYTDLGQDPVQFIADASGNYTFALDLSEARDVVVQPGKSTITIDETGGGCTSPVGAWSAVIKTCTLTQDVNDAILVWGTGVTLDGAGHQVNLPPWGYVRVSGPFNTIKNLTISGQGYTDPLSGYIPINGYGVLLYEASHATVTNVTVSNTYYGIWIYDDWGSTIKDNTFSGVARGATARYAYHNTFSDNTFSSFSADYDYSGIEVTFSSGNTFMSNTISGFENGLYLYGGYLNCGSIGQYCSRDNKVYHNNFIDNHPQQILVYDPTLNSGNIFNLAAPDGGNYFDDFDEPVEGCSDGNGDRFCDSAYNFEGGADQLPWTMAGGWANQPPTADAGGPYSGDEGSTIALSGTSASDPDSDSLIYNWNVSSPLCSFDDASALDPGLTCVDSGTFVVTLTVSDGTASATDDTMVMVNNVAPAIESITVPVEPVNINQQPVSALATFSDQAGSNDAPFTCTVDYGDGTEPQTGTVSGTTCTGSSYSYAVAGVYQITVTVTDKDGASDRATAVDYIVIYNPAGGFVTGSGWIYSQSSWCQLDDVCAGAEGRASFGFVSEYKKGASRPSGITEFNFTAGGLNFHSDRYDWLVVTQGGTNAQYKGEGTVNRALAPSGTRYKFMLWAKVNDPTYGDTFRIRIWYEDNGAEIDVYDNGFDQVIEGGKIQIHES